MTASRFAHRAVLALATLWIVACADVRLERTRKPRATPQSPAPVVTTTVIPTAPVRDECFGADMTETSAMVCSAGAVSRIADTLQILLSSGRVVRRVDVPSGGESNQIYRYDGRIGGSSGGPAYHVLNYRGYESGGAELINAQTGDSLFIAQRPLISPDGARLVVDDMSGLEIGKGKVLLQIWRITGDKPVSELDLRPYAVGADRGWGPSKVEWRSADTITLLRNTIPRDSTRRARSDWDTARSVLVHKAGAWVLDPRH